MPTTINDNQFFLVSHSALIFLSITFVFLTAIDSYTGSHSFLKLAIIPSFLSLIFILIYFSGDNNYKRHKAQKHLPEPAEL